MYATLSFPLFHYVFSWFLEEFRKSRYIRLPTPYNITPIVFLLRHNIINSCVLSLTCDITNKCHMLWEH